MDLLHIYDEKTQARELLVSESKEKIAEIMKMETVPSEKMVNLFSELSLRLSQHRGKKTYRFLKADDKKVVDEIVRELSGDEKISELYKEWCDCQNKIISTYKSELTKHPPLWENENFKQIKNAVVKQVLSHVDDRIFVDTEDSPTDIPTEEELMDLEKIIPYDAAKIYDDAECLYYHPDKALYWFEQSANQGNQFAQYRLGKLLYDSDTEKALEWLTASADQGNEYAEFALGRHYYYEKDMEKALYWFNRSATQGNEYAKNMLEFIQNSNRHQAHSGIMSLLNHLSKIIRDDYEERLSKFIKVDSKIMHKIMEKKQAQGQKIT